MRLRSLAAILALAAILPGCAAFRGGELGPISDWPPSRGSLAGSRPANVIFQGVGGNLLRSLREPTIRAYEESGLFVSVRSGAPHGGNGINAIVRVKHRGQWNPLMAFLSGLTLALVPSRAVDSFEITTRFLDGEGNALAEVRRSETMTGWIQLFLAPASPFMSFNRVLDRTYYDLARASLVEAAPQLSRSARGYAQGTSSSLPVLSRPSSAR